MFTLIDTVSDTLLEKERMVINRLQRLESAIVAYSGGVDSSLVAYYAKEILGARAKIVIAVSPSLDLDDLEAARAQASMFEWDLLESNTDEVENKDYQRNDDMRCYYCKATLFAELSKMAAAHSIDSIIYGANADDHNDYRPGRIAAHQYHVIAPLEEADVSKLEVRTLARLAGLPSWDRPQNACLSSRIPRNIPVEIDSLKQVELSERIIRSLGFQVVRVRHHIDKAVVEIGQSELGRLAQEPYLVNKIEQGLHDIGYKEVAIDPRGYRQGAANDANWSDSTLVHTH